jgi:hypothetical protein
MESSSAKRFSAHPFGTVPNWARFGHMPKCSALTSVEHGLLVTLGAQSAEIPADRALLRHVRRVGRPPMIPRNAELLYLVLKGRAFHAEPGGSAAGAAQHPARRA